MSKGRTHYKQLVSSNLFGIADKIKEARKNPRKRKFNKKRK